MTYYARRSSASFIGASFSTHIWHLLLSQGVCFGLGLGFCFTATIGVVPQWFTKRRSFANSVATSGSGFGGLIYSLGTNAMISNIGLAWALRILAIIAFVVIGGSSLVVRDRNKAVGAVHVAFHKDLFKQGNFLLFVGWGFFAIFGYVIVVFSITDYALQMGFSADQGSIAAAMFNCKLLTEPKNRSVPLTSCSWHPSIAGHWEATHWPGQRPGREDQCRRAQYSDSRPNRVFHLDLRRDPFRGPHCVRALRHVYRLHLAMRCPCRR